MSKLISPVIVFVIAAAGTCFAQQDDWSGVEQIFGKKGTVQDNILKITFPRSDLNVKVGDFSISPGLAFTTWIAFMKMDNTSTMMGDLVVLDKEVP